MLGDNMLNEFLHTPSPSSSLPAFWALIAVIPLLLLISPGPKVVIANSEFTVYRMQHYDFQGKSRGCRNSMMNLEARTRKQLSTSFAKKCVIIKLVELIEHPDSFKELLQTSIIGGILILVPSFNTLSAQQIEEFMQLEKSLINELTIYIPVYFAKENQELGDIYESIDNSAEDSADSFFTKLFKSVIANGYQVSVMNSQPMPINAIFTNIEGMLVGNGLEDQLPTITITAHYDAFGISPGLSFGSNSNGSGVIALLELARLFSKFYSNSKTAPRVNLLFLLSSSGKYSYLGTKKWLESNLDSNENVLLTDSLVTLCLDTIGGPGNLYAHVSKPPKESSPSAIFLASLNKINNVTLVHKKINLADEYLAWEHERFSIRRLPAMSLSSCSSHRDLNRGSIADVIIDVKNLIKNIEMIGEGLGRLLYGESREGMLKGDYKVSSEFVEGMIRQINGVPRAQQLLITEKINDAKNVNKVAPLLKTIEAVMKKYLKEVKLTHYKGDGEIVFYKPIEIKMNAYNVNCITDLDDYSLIEIFTHISNIREKVRLKRVCKRFHDIATKSLKLHHYITRRNHLYYAHEIRTSARPHLPLDRLLNCCPYIKHLNSLAFDRICWNKKRLPAQLDFQSLSLFGWSHMKISMSLLPKCKSLKSLEIGTSKYPKRSSTSSSSFPLSDYEWDLCCVKSNLVSLRLEGVNYSLDSIKKYMQERGSNLKYFAYSSWSLKDNSNLDTSLPYSLIDILFRYTNIEKIELELKGAVKLIDNDTSCLPECTSLRSLSIKSDSGIINLLRCILASCTNINDLLIVEPLYDDKEILESCKRYVNGKVKICSFSLTNFYANR